MNRRLYFLFPDVAHANTTAEDLMAAGIEAPHLHAVSNAQNQHHSLPETSARQQNDLAGKLERIAWNANLILFLTTAVLTVVLVAQGSYAWSAASLAVMLISFMSGERFTHVPDVHLNEFRDALHHGEILLMVDIPQHQVADVERRVTRRHPEAVPGGSSWQTDVFAL